MAFDDVDQFELDTLVGAPDDDSPDSELKPEQAWCLYLSHFLSMWNSRAYEYGTVLFAQRAWSGGLLPSSIIGISQTVCVLASSAAVGRWIDSSTTRLRPLLVSIIANRVTLVLSCVIWLSVFNTDTPWLQRLLFGAILTLGMAEKTTRMSNTLSFERDWIPAVANCPSRDGSCGVYDLTYLNTVVRRIDVACKFVAPLAVSGSMSIFSITAVVTSIAGVSLLSVCIEVWTLLRVWRQNRRLRAVKPQSERRSRTKLVEQDVNPSPSHRLFNRLFHIMFWAIGMVGSQFEGWRYYFSTDVWIPSIATALLHASVLAWAGTLVTYLLNAGFTYVEITVAKAAGSVFEVGSTFVFPWAVSTFTKRLASQKQRPNYQRILKSTEGTGVQNLEPDDDDSDTNDTLVAEQHAQEPGDSRPIVTTGKWGIIGLCVNAILTVALLFTVDSATSSRLLHRDDTLPDAFAKAPLASVLFFAFLSFYFLGRWTCDLSVTQLTQTLIPASHRSEFGGAEMALVALMSLLHWLAAAIWHAQSDFKWLGAVSLCAVMIATAAYITWARAWNAQISMKEQYGLDPQVQ